MLKVIRKRTAATLLMAAPHRADKTFDAATNRTDLGHADQLHPVALAVGGKRLVGGLTGSSSPVGSSLAHRLIIRGSARSTIVPTCAASRPLAAETLRFRGRRESFQLSAAATTPGNAPPQHDGGRNVFSLWCRTRKFRQVLADPVCRDIDSACEHGSKSRCEQRQSRTPESPFRPATAARVRRPRGVLRVRSRLNGRPRPRAGPPRGRGSLSVSAQAVARDLGIQGSCTRRVRS